MCVRKLQVYGNMAMGGVNLFHLAETHREWNKRSTAEVVCLIAFQVANYMHSLSVQMHTAGWLICFRPFSLCNIMWVCVCSKSVVFSGIIQQLQQPLSFSARGRIARLSLADKTNKCEKTAIRAQTHWVSPRRSKPVCSRRGRILCAAKLDARWTAESCQTGLFKYCTLWRR